MDSLSDQLCRWLAKHQQVLSIILSSKEADGICRISRKEIAAKMDVSPTLIARCIATINREGTIIDYSPQKGGYYVYEDNVMNIASFVKVIDFMNIIINDPSKIEADEKVMAEQVGCSRKTIQAAKAFLYSSFYKDKT